MITKEECLNFKSIGRLNPGIEAKIIDPITNAALPVNTHGELVIKSVCIMKGTYPSQSSYQKIKLVARFSNHAADFDI